MIKVVKFQPHSYRIDMVHLIRWIFATVERDLYITRFMCNKTSWTRMTGANMLGWTELRSVRGILKV